MAHPPRRLAIALALPVLLTGAGAGAYGQDRNSSTTSATGGSIVETIGPIRALDTQGAVERVTGSHLRIDTRKMRYLPHEGARQGGTRAEGACTPVASILNIQPADGSSLERQLHLSFAANLSSIGDGVGEATFCVQYAISVAPSPGTCRTAATFNHNVPPGTGQTWATTLDRRLDPGTYILTIKVFDKFCESGGIPAGAQILASSTTVFTIEP